MKADFTVSHHGGSASTHQHMEKLTIIKKGTPTLEEIYLHMHCRLENGKSPVIAQYEAASGGVSKTTEVGDTNGIVNPPTEETTIPTISFDINSLQFTNKRAKKVYEDVTKWRADEANADKDESILYMDAVGGSSRGRIRGFGSMLDHKMPTANTRARSSLSGVTQNEPQKTYTDEEVNVILTQERDQRLNEEREERKRMQVENNIMLGQLFAMFGMRRPNYQGQGPTTLPHPQEGASGMPMAISQGLGADFIEANRRGTFQALLNAQTGQEVTTCQADFTQWFGEENQNNPF